MSTIVGTLKDNNGNDFLPITDVSLVSGLEDIATIRSGSAAGIPPGGNASQVLKKVDSTDYNVKWANSTETLPSAYCTTSDGTAAKQANCSLYVTQANQYLQVLIGSANTYQGALTLNINSAGAKPIYINGTASSSTNYTLPNGTYFVFYDGTNYYFRTDGKIEGPSGTLYIKPSTGIPSTDLENGVIPTVPIISTNIVNDKADNTKTTGAKAVYDEIHPAVATSQPSGGMLPNVMYKFGTLSANTTFEFSEPTDNTIVNHYFLTFDTGSTVYTVTFVALSSWGSTITWQSSLPSPLTANKHYEVSIIDGIGIFMEV